MPNINIAFKRRLVNYLLKSACILESDSGRLFITQSSNPRIFKLLHEINFFKFHVTNQGSIVGVSQIIAFLSYGWKAYANGFTASKDFIEVHHKNGDVKDNSPSNLVYLSRQDHQYVSSCTYTPFFGKVKYEASTPFNKQGKAVSNPFHFLANIIQETVKAVSSKRTCQPVSLSYIEVLTSLPKSLWKSSKNYTKLPTWLSNSIFQLINPNNHYSYNYA